VLKGGFEKYLADFKPFLMSALDNHEDSQVCLAAIGVVSALCRAFEIKIFPIMDEIMQKLLAILQVFFAIKLLIINIYFFEKIQYLFKICAKMKSDYLIYTK